MEMSAGKAEILFDGRISSSKDGQTVRKEDKKLTLAPLCLYIGLISKPALAEKEGSVSFEYGEM
jgi:hypothetical protein